MLQVGGREKFREGEVQREREGVREREEEKRMDKYL